MITDEQYGQMTVHRRSEFGYPMTPEDRSALIDEALQVNSVWKAEELRRTFFRFRNNGVMAWREFLDDAKQL